MFNHFICIFLLLAPYSHSHKQPAAAYVNGGVKANSQATYPTTVKPVISTPEPATTTVHLIEDDDLSTRDRRLIEAHSFQVKPGPATDHVKLKTDTGIFIVTSTPKTTFPNEKSNISVHQSTRGNVGHRQPQPVPNVPKVSRIEYPKLAPPPKHKHVVLAEKEKEHAQAVSQPEVSRTAPPNVVIPERLAEPTHSTSNPYSRKDYYPAQDTLSRRAHLNNFPQQLYEAPIVVQAADLPSNELEPPEIIVAEDSSFESTVYGNRQEHLDLSKLTKSPSPSVVLTKSISVEKKPEETNTNRLQDTSLLEQSGKTNPKNDVLQENSLNRPSATGSLFEGGRVESSNYKDEPRKDQGFESRKDAVSLFDAEVDVKETPRSVPSLLETRDELRLLPYVSAPQSQNAPLPPAPPPSEQRNQISFSYATLDADLTDLTDIGSIIESVSNDKRRRPVTAGPVPPVGPPVKPSGGTLPPSPVGPARPPSPPSGARPPSIKDPVIGSYSWSGTNFDPAPTPNTNSHENEQNNKPLVVIYNVHHGAQAQPASSTSVHLPASPSGSFQALPLGNVQLAPAAVPAPAQPLPPSSTYGVAPPASPSIAYGIAPPAPVLQQPVSVQLSPPSLSNSYGIAPPAFVQQQAPTVQVLSPTGGTSYGIAPPAPIFQQPSVSLASPATSFSLPGYVLQDQKTHSFSSQQASFPVSTYGAQPIQDTGSVILQSQGIQSYPTASTFQIASPTFVAAQPQIVSLGGTLSGNPIRTVVRTRTRLADRPAQTQASNPQQQPSSYGSYAGRQGTSDQELRKRTSYSYQKPKSSYGVPQPPASAPAPAYAPPASAYAPPAPGYDYYAPAPPAPPLQDPVLEDEVQQFLQPVYYQPLPSFQFTPVIGGKGKKKEKDKEKSKFKFFGKDKKCGKHYDCESGGGVGQSDEGTRGQQELGFSDPTAIFGPNEQINFQYQYRGDPGEGPLAELKRVFFSGAVLLGAFGMIPSMATTIRALFPAAATAAAATGRRKRDLSQVGVWNETAWKEMTHMKRVNISLFDALPHSGAPIPEDLLQELEPYVPSFEAIEHTECLQKQFCENLLETGRLKYKENMLLFYSFLSPDAEENPWLMQSLTAARKNKCSDFYCTASDKSKT